MSKSSIKAVIDAAIKQNGTKSITGPVLNSVLNQMVDEVPDVVNDKTTGGTTKAWSAEQGKDLSADVSQLAQEVGELDSEINATIKDYYTGSGYIGTNGTIQSSSAYKVTPLLEYLGGNICIKNSYNGSSSCAIAFYNSSGAFISGIAGSGLTPKSYNILSANVPAGTKYFRCSTYIGTEETAVYHFVYKDFSEDIQSLKENEIVISSILSESVVANIQFDKTGFINTAGNVVVNADYVNTGLFPKFKYGKIKYRVFMAGNQPSISFYDADGQIISSLSILNSDGQENEIDLTQSQYNNVYYVALSNRLPDLATGYYANLYTENNTEVKNAEEIHKIIENLSYERYTQSGYIGTNGAEVSNAQYKRTPFISYEGGNIFILKTRNGTSSCVVAFYDNNKTFISGITGQGSISTIDDYIFDSSNVPAGTKYIRCCSYDGGQNPSIFVKGGSELSSNFLPSGSEKMNILIFGDSITTCASFTINEDDETTAYQLNHLSNSYYNAGGILVRYDMWPYLIKQYLNAFDVRNYAYSGASYKDDVREEGKERQNLSYQIKVAENDLTNPNNAFPTIGSYVPDIIIFALGTNDGNPNDTYDSAMAKTIMNAEGTAVDVSATLANLDRTKFNEAARYAFLKLKNMFPYAITICVLPIQRAAPYNTPNISTLHDALKKMAEMHSIIVVDGAFDSGIITDNEVNNGLGLCLKDGLHPNDKGQNLMTRMILNAIKNNWINLSMMNP